MTVAREEVRNKTKNRVPEHSKLWKMRRWEKTSKEDWNANQEDRRKTRGRVAGSPSEDFEEEGMKNWQMPPVSHVTWGLRTNHYFQQGPLLTLTWAILVGWWGVKSTLGQVQVRMGGGKLERVKARFKKTDQGAVFNRKWMCVCVCTRAHIQLI